MRWFSYMRLQLFQGITHFSSQYSWSTATFESMRIRCGVQFRNSPFHLYQQKCWWLAKQWRHQCDEVNDGQRAIPKETPQMTNNTCCWCCCSTERSCLSDYYNQSSHLICFATIANDADVTLFFLSRYVYCYLYPLLLFHPLSEVDLQLNAGKCCVLM